MKNSDRPAMPNKLYNNKAMNGLTKREYFAGLAMQGLINVYWNSDIFEQYDNPKDLVKCLAEASVEHADALLKELGKDE